MQYFLSFLPPSQTDWDSALSAQRSSTAPSPTTLEVQRMHLPLLHSLENRSRSTYINLRPPGPSRPLSINLRSRTEIPRHIWVHLSDSLPSGHHINTIVSTLLDTFRFRNWMPSRIVSRKVQETTRNFYHRCLIVERHSHWYPHQDDGGCYTLDMHTLWVKNEKKQWLMQWYSYIKHFVDPDDEAKGVKIGGCP